MKLGFTEFSYGYAFTENLIRSSASGPATAPVFPNLVQEAKLGYDVRIDMPGSPLFFQFKLPELMVRDTAREIAQLGLAGLSTPFFRMPLMRRDLSDQHAHLIRLEAKFPGAVYYASPTCESSAAFNTSYALAQVHTSSVLISPGAIGPLPDDRSHVVSYVAGATFAWRCSEPEKVKVADFAAISNAVAERLTKNSDDSLEKTVGQIREKVWPLVPEGLRGAEGAIRDRFPLVPDGADVGTEEDARIRKVTREILVLREVVRVGLGVDFVIAQPREHKKEIETS